MREPMMAGLRRAALDALLIVAGGSTLGIVVNGFHPNGIPYVATEAYETLVPCPVGGGPVAGVGAAGLETDDVFFVDAGSAAEPLSVAGAVRVPYDYLDPTPAEVLESLARDIARSGARRVVVVGDGDQPDTGEELAKEISGFGIKNVFFVRGGAPALAAEKP